jgi:glycosyltransferase involved in cell wall biosynthesis
VSSLVLPRKKLLVIVSLLPGNGPTGVETHFNHIMAYASSCGIETNLVTPHNSHWFWRKVPNGIGRIFALLSLEYSMAWNRMIASRRLSAALRSVFINNQQHDIVLYAQDPLSALAALAVRKIMRCRVVAVSHFNISEADEMFIKGLIEKDGLIWRELIRTEEMSFVNVDKLIFVSRFMRNVVNQRLPELYKVDQSIIPNFTSSVISDDEVTIQGDLISIGTLEPRKNQRYLLKVLSECKKLGHKYSLTIVGDGPDRLLLESMAKSLDVADQVTFLGFVSLASKLISSHRVFVHASEMESFGIVVLESLVRGRPVITASVGGIPEIITEGVEGYFWRLDDPKGGASILISLLNNPALLNEMSIQAKITFETKFNPLLLARTWLDSILGEA